MIKSKHNIVSKLLDSEDFFVVNLLSEQADILSKSEAEILLNGGKEIPEEFIEKGYFVEEKEEEKLYRKKYLEFIDDRETDEVQLFFVPTYACNFACSYCYQDEYGIKEQELKTEIIDAFFNYVDAEFAERQKYITIFGGEPLLNSENQRKFLTYFIEKSNERKLDLAFVTNGYYLEEYIPLLKQGSIREVQVTLDGTAGAHDKRRMLKGGAKSFEKIVSGINAALSNTIPVNLRMVLDKENIGELPKLSKFAIDSGWTTSPLFKTQLGRNYELHHCQSGASRLYSRVEMYKDIYELLKKHPYIAEFHQTAFSVSKFLFEEGKLPSSLFDSCPGTKTEWAFDFSGKIFSCTATVGKPGEELGTYYPEVTKDNEQIEEWQDRDVLSIEKCGDCPLQLACGGGCASVARNQHGAVNSPDCRPIKELLELGISHYFRD